MNIAEAICKRKSIRDYKPDLGNRLPGPILCEFTTMGIRRAFGSGFGED